MTERENCLRIIRFDCPERVVSSIPSYTLAYHGCNHEGYEGGGHHLPVGTTWTDIWQVVWQKEQKGIMAFPRGNPLRKVEYLRGYPWPDPNDERICGPIYAKARDYPGGDCFLGGSHRNLLWEKANKVVGMEELMMAFLTEPEFTREVLHRIMDFQLAIARHYLAVGVEFVFISEDLGTQTGPLLGPQIMHEFLVPEYGRLFELYKPHKILIHLHSCGNIEGMIPMFLELGVNVLNPVQADANNLTWVRAATQGRIALHGGVSCKTLLAGPVERIREEVRERCWQLGRAGGYFCDADQGLPFPQQHLAAFQQAVSEYGRYPMTAPSRPRDEGE